MVVILCGLIVIKIVDDMLTTGPDNIVRMFAADFGEAFALGTISHGLGVLGSTVSISCNRKTTHVQSTAMTSLWHYHHFRKRVCLENKPMSQ